MPSLKKRVVEYLSESGYKPMKPKAVAKKLGLKKKATEKFFELIDTMADNRELRRDENNCIRLPGPAKGEIQGTLRKVSTGNGYVILHEPKPAGLTQDVFIEQRDIGDAQTGDIVAVALTRRTRSGGQRCGRITEVIERATNRFVGIYFEEDEQGYVFIDGSNYEEAIWVGDPGAKGALPDDKVVIEMLRFPTHYQVGEAVVTEVLGPRGTPGVDTLSVIHEYGLPTDFSPEALAQATKQASEFESQDRTDRLDLTDETIVTIDPASARDFDDAISLKKIENGHWELGVHIADVSHFVQPNTPLDREAYKRGTSVYLPTKVIPMLPEVLSNGLASLQQDRERFVKTAFIEFTPEGMPVGTRFANSMIKVTKRFHYEHVGEFLLAPEKYTDKYGETICQLLLSMQELARTLRKRRFEGGALELSMPEVRLNFDADGKVTGAYEAEHDESHQIIEEFMLAANIAVATELTDREISFLRRTHGAPAGEKLEMFKDFVEVLGFPLPHKESRKDIQSLLDKTNHTPLQRAVHFAFLRSLKQAEYSPAEEGHYALAAENYCHFTSPIRRYPDLTVHRLIDRLIIRGEEYKGENESELQKVATHCGLTERRAEKAERELTKLKLMEYMEQRVGEEFEAVITGAERFGIFCQCLDVPAEGLIPIDSLHHIDRFYYVRESRSLIGKQTDIRLRLGAAVRVKITHVDIDRRELDMELIKVHPEKTQKKTRSAQKKKRIKKRDRKQS